MIEIDPELKRGLYAELVREGRTLKDWFVAQVEEYLAHGRQAPLFAADRPARPYGKGESADE